MGRLATRRRSINIIFTDSEHKAPSRGHFYLHGPVPSAGPLLLDRRRRKDDIVRREKNERRIK